MKVKIGNFPKNYKTQRTVQVHIDYYDTWNMYHTLALIIYPMLVQLKETKKGVPAEFADVGGENYASQSSFDFYAESHSEAFDAKVKLWDDVLDKMIWSFEQLIDDNYDDKYHHGEPHFDWVKTDDLYHNPTTGVMEPAYQMVDREPNEYWYDVEGHKLHDERIQEGLELFGKYFRNLWD